MKKWFSSGRLAQGAPQAVFEPLEMRRLLHAGHLGIFINAGGEAYADSAGHLWQQDAYFAGGQAKGASYDAAGTADDAVYASRRFGATFGYSIPVASGGEYQLTLLFSEPWFTRRGQRVFDVSAENSPVLRNFDLLAVTAPKTAVMRTFTVAVNDGVLDVSFVAVVDAAIISGIAVERVVRAPSAPGSLTAAVVGPDRVWLRWVDQSTDETGFAIERSLDGVSFTRIAVVGANAGEFTDHGVSPGLRYTYRVRAINSAGTSGPSPAATVTPPAGARQPFGQRPIRLPGTLEAENFDDGGQGVSYFDASVENAGGMYRDTPVDIYPIRLAGAPASTGPTAYGVGSLRSGEWLEYTIEVPETSEFSVQASFASGSQGGTATIRLNGLALREGLVLPNTGGWSRFTLLRLGRLRIPAGRHVLRISFDRAARTGEELGVLDWLQFTSTGTARPLPAAPVDLAARGAGDTQINLSWIDAATDETGYLVQRSTGDGAFIEIASLPPGTTWFADTSVRAATSYVYRVLAVNSAGTSPAAEVTVGSWSPDSFRWKRAAGSPLGRYEAAGAAVNGKLYVFGGYVNEQIQATARVDAYDPARNAWKRLTDMPEIVTHAGQAVDGAIVYLAGGFVGDHPGLGTRSVWRYDTSADRWDRMPPLPQPRGAGALALVGQTLHFFGGLSRAQFATINQRQHWALDLLNPSLGWNSRAPLPNPRNHLAAVALGGKIYAIGGQDLWNELSGAMANVDVYDPETDTWSAAAPLPVPRSHIAASSFALNGQIYVIGGATNGFTSLRDVTIYDPASDRWRIFRQLPGPRLSPVAGAIGRMLIVATGCAYGLQPQGETFFGLLD
ncbi:MAG: malectin domain-containing carbohydrate-binding protein [Phycisphaerae bacterium]|nr:malectin domain-containing carbohydrate-binding protein [Phycisphaerae bacterium]MDW8260884.1 kelch repeat-containing protein [Phycisphaerales bacterium]